MRLTWKLFADACEGARGVYNLEPADVDAYTALLREALEGDYSQVKPIKFGCWHFARTKPISLDFMHGQNRYEITLERMATIEDIAHWVDHLHEKVWFNCHEVHSWHRKQPRIAPDPESPLNFFKALVALNQKGLLLKPPIKTKAA